MTAPEAESLMEETDTAQPANFALQVGLAALWRGILYDKGALEEARDRLSMSEYRVGYFYYRQRWYPGASSTRSEKEPSV